MEKTKNKKETILIKLSGASLKGEDDLISFTFLNDLGNQIKTLLKKYNVAVVLGGGNIWRGNVANNYQMERYNADYMGMLATLMNSLAFESVLKNLNVPSKIYSSLDIDKIANTHIIKNVINDLDLGIVTILSCGTGMPYFSTDTGAAIRAAEINAKFILMGKNNVNGVYSGDPLKDKNAVFYEHLNYSDLIKNNLKIMDLSALTICSEFGIKIIVFKINEKNSIINVVEKKCKYTTIG